jgi:signal peptidase I
VKNLNKTLSKLFLDFLEILFISASIVILTFFFLAQPLIVTGDSMLPTFEDREQIIVEKISVKYEALKRGEVVVVKHPDNPKIFLIKRVVGLPGELFTISAGKVHINKAVLEEPYLSASIKTTSKPYIGENEDFVIPGGTYVLLGDNRENSADSRLWGPVSEDSIVGRTFMVYYPLKNIRLVQ